MSHTIIAFSGYYRFLSNFYPAPLVYEGLLYPTAEHAYQAAKSLDDDIREHIKNLPLPGQAKRRGRSVILRDDWENVKLYVMREIVGLKFYSNSRLLKLLMATNDAELIEGNTWGDTFWGKTDVTKGSSIPVWEGQNWLGRILMSLRNEAFFAGARP